MTSIRSRISGWLLGISFEIARRLASSRYFTPLLAFSLAHMSFLIPTQRLHETPTLLAFHHPGPSYPLHILIVPKRHIAGLSRVSPTEADFIRDLFAAVRSLVQRFALEERGYRLIANGGAYQDIPHLHFHLISGNELNADLTKL